MALAQEPHLDIRASRLPHGMSETARQDESAFRWLRSGEAVLSAMLAAIGEARRSVRLETYICGVKFEFGSGSQQGLQGRRLLQRAFEANWRRLENRPTMAVPVQLEYSPAWIVLLPRT